MRAFSEFQNMSIEFWAFVKFISEKLGYTKRGKGIVRNYSEKQIKGLCKKENINIPDEMLEPVINYLNMRADILNNFVESMLMNAEQARTECCPLLQLHDREDFLCKIPQNKQKGDKKQISYFTAAVNILAEKTIREALPNVSGLGFDDDPKGLTRMHNDNGALLGVSSRRFDGAYPGIKNPKMVWEIKEYYYATTFGSRVADGVYETQLDGYEFKELYERTGQKIYHVLFIDAYQTWWVKGKSYLCRIIDALNMGLVDEVIFGREVFTRWPELLKSML